MFVDKSNSIELLLKINSDEDFNCFFQFWLLFLKTVLSFCQKKTTLSFFIEIQGKQVVKQKKVLTTI